MSPFTNWVLKFVTLTDGSDSNQLVKVGIRDIKPAGTVAGSDFGSFTVVVRKFSDTDQKPVVYETFQGCNLDSNSTNYVAKKIGDMRIDWDTAEKLNIIPFNFWDHQKFKSTDRYRIDRGSL